MWPYFSSSCYTGFGDDSKGFYAVYDKLFKEIDEEERKPSEQSDSEQEKEEKEKQSSKKSSPKAPTFGNSSTPYKDVQKFYDYWRSFMSKRSFAYCDKYKLNTVTFLKRDKGYQS